MWAMVCLHKISRQDRLFALCSFSMESWTTVFIGSYRMKGCSKYKYQVYLIDFVITLVKDSLLSMSMLSSGIVAELAQ